MAAKKGTKKAVEETAAKEAQDEVAVEETTVKRAVKAEEKANGSKEEAAEVKEPGKKEEKRTQKAIGTKKDTTKAIETKAGVMVESKPAEEEKAPVEKKAAEKKPAAKKPAVKKNPAKAEIKTEIFLQYENNEFTEKEILKKVKEIWTKGLKRKVGDMKEVKIYLKPEEYAAYFVVNGDVSEKVDLRTL